MDKAQVKAKSEEMAAQIFEYINAVGISQKEQDEICLEIGTSFLTAAVHTGDKREARDVIMGNALCMGMLGCEGYFKFLDGKNDKIIKDLSDYGD